MEVIVKARKKVDFDNESILTDKQKKNCLKNMAKSMLDNGGFKEIDIKVRDYY